MVADTLNAGYYTSSYTLPQVFFGKDLIGGYEEIHGKNHSMHGDLPVGVSAGVADLTMFMYSMS
jgi:hypothetical protein